MTACLILHAGADWLATEVLLAVLMYITCWCPPLHYAAKVGALKVQLKDASDQRLLENEDEGEIDDRTVYLVLDLTTPEQLEV